MILIDTPRLHLRNFVAEDAEPLRESAMQYRASPLGVYDHEWPTSIEEIKNTVNWFCGGDNFIAVCLKETGAYIGFVDLMKSDEPGQRAYDLGYLFNFNYHGQGYASEACSALVDYAFQALQADQLTSGTAQANHASQRVLEKLGFLKINEGLVHFQNDAEGNPIVFTGYGYALTREIWEKRNKTENAPES